MNDILCGIVFYKIYYFNRNLLYYNNCYYSQEENYKDFI